MTTKELNDLSPESRVWVKGILKSFRLESHHEKLLLTCGQALDRINEARKAVKEAGAFYEDKHGVIRPHPGIKAENDAKILFNRSLRELDLDAEVSPTTRPPAIRSNRG